MEKSSSHPAVALCPCRYPNTACELLTCDVPQINDRLGGDETLLNVLYNFLDREPPLNPLLASFFSKTIGNLIARKTEQVIIRPAHMLWEGGSADAWRAVLTVPRDTPGAAWLLLWEPGWMKKLASRERAAGLLWMSSTSAVREGHRPQARPACPLADRSHREAQALLASC